MAEEMHSKSQHEFRGFPEFSRSFSIVIATAKEITAMYNDNLEPETEPRSVTFFPA